MNNVRSLRKNELAKAKGEGEVVIAGTVEVDDAQARATRCDIQSGVRRANENAVDFLPVKPFRQIKHLLRTTIKMASGFYMQYFH